MSTATEQEATVNPDGTTGGGESAWEGAAGAGTNSTFAGGEDETFTDAPPGEEEENKVTDPAIYLGLGVVVCLVLLMVYQIYQNRKRKQYSELKFFADMDGDKFDLNLPDAVDEYYKVKQQCMDQGWQPGKPPANAQEAQSGPHRTMAQALMKRCIADIPLVQFIQKESTGMNKLYSQSMCSVKQWRMYQAAETLISTEVEEVRAEADEIEPGWSNMIWRQAMQYHGMLKQKHEAEARAMAQAAERKRALEAQAEAAKKNAAGGGATAKKAPAAAKKKAAAPVLTPEQQAAAAEKAARELLQQEEKEKKASNKKGGGSGGMKKGFLENKKKGK